MGGGGNCCPMDEITIRTFSYGKTILLFCFCFEKTWILINNDNAGTITVLCAGTADLSVAEEAAVVAELCGAKVKLSENENIRRRRRRRRRRRSYGNERVGVGERGGQKV
jgi:hypothetical protein